MKAELIPIQWTPSMSIYASEQYLRIVGDEYGWFGGKDASGALHCILPYTIIRKAGVRMARFRIETIPIGDGIAVDEEKAFLQNVADLLLVKGVDCIIPASTNTIFRTYPNKAIAAPYGSHIVDLTQHEDSLWKNLHSKHRNVIRNAQNKGVEIRYGLEYADAVYRLISQTLQRSKKGFMSPASYRGLLEGLGEYVIVAAAFFNGAIQAGAIIQFSDYCAYYVYGGTAEKSLTGAANLLQWEAFKFFRNRGVGKYDFCGARIDPARNSKAAGLIMFKERFGAQLHRGYMWKLSLTRIKPMLYSLAIRLLRGGDIVDSERRRRLNGN